MSYSNGMGVNGISYNRPMKKQVQVYADKSVFVQASVKKIAESILRNLKEKGDCRLVLAGGNTPREIYAELAASFRDRIQWQDLQLFWGDERMVPSDHPDSNYRMAKETLIDIVRIHRSNVHRIKGELGAPEAAVHYAKVIRDSLPESPPRFDLILLGLGEDGHTASLFPDTEALDEQRETVAANFVPGLNSWRVTMTLPVLNNAREIVFLVAGDSKAEILRRVINSSLPDKQLPATLVRPKNGSVHWMLGLSQPL